MFLYPGIAHCYAASLWSKSVSERTLDLVSDSHICAFPDFRTFPSPGFFSQSGTNGQRSECPERHHRGQGRLRGCVARDHVEKNSRKSRGRTWPPPWPSAPSSRPTRGFCFEKVRDPCGPGNDLTGLRACFSSFLNFNGHVPIYLSLRWSELTAGIIFQHKIGLKKTELCKLVFLQPWLFFILILPFRSFYIFYKAKFIFSYSEGNEPK